MKKESKLISLLSFIARVIPSDRGRNFFYLNFIYRVRKFIRLSVGTFYRMEHVYETISEFEKNYKGTFSILEFGVSDGYAFTKKLFATHYLKMTDRITVHGFDTFEGMPETKAPEDKGLTPDAGWVEGQFASSYDNLESYCRSRYSNFELHKGFFKDTLTDEFLDKLRSQLPMLIWIDCDYYTSAKSIFDRIASYIPSGCVIYFDEYEFNYGSRFTGEARIVHEINRGDFGPGLELVLDPALSLDSKRVYRFINLDCKYAYQPKVEIDGSDYVHRRTNDSIMP